MSAKDVSLRKLCVFFLLFMFLFSLTACNSGMEEPTPEDLLTTVDWININDEDRYSFYVDGTGKHGKISITYTYDPQSKTMEVIEGIGNVVPCTFTLNTDKDYPRLIAEDMSTFYVASCDYEKISEIVRGENIEILTSVGSWQTVSTWTGKGNLGVGDIRLIFKGDGAGRIVFYYKSEKYVDSELTWKMLDNNTLDCSFIAFEDEYDLDLDISNINGEYKLFVHNDPSIFYLPDI